VRGESEHTQPDLQLPARGFSGFW